MIRLSIAALLLTGCASFSTMSTARTLPRDATQTWLAPEFVGLTFDSGTSHEQVSVPQIELGVRRGITDDFELGGKVWLLGAAIESKLQLVRSPSPDAGIDVALAPSIGWLGFNSGDARFNVITGYLNLPIGLNVGGGSQLVVTPKAIYQRYQASDSTGGGGADLVFLGGSLGFAMRLGNAYVLPEISVMQPVVNPGSNDVIQYQGVVFQGGVGLLFGG